MRSALAHLLVLLAVGIAAPAALAEEPAFEMTMPAQLGADNDGDGLVDYANSAAEFRAEEKRRGGFEVELTVRHDLCRKGADYIWRSAAGVIAASGGAGCGVSQTFPREGDYPVRLEVRLPGGRVEEFEQQVAVRDWLVVSIGDSVGSGEGNPDIPGSFKRAHWQSARCHRSAKAGSAQAALTLEAADPATSATFVHLACSGAAIGEGLLGGYRGADPGPDPEPRLLAPQVDELEQIAGERHVDAVVLSVGANDVYFGQIVRFCLEKSDCTRRIFEPEDKLHPPPSRPQTLAEVVAEALSRLPAEYEELAQHLSAVVEPSHVLIVDYFDPTRDENGDFCRAIGTPLPGRFLKIDREEAQWAATGILEPINTRIGEAAREAGWTEVTGVAAAFRTHGYCAAEPWIQHLTQSIATQHGNSLFSLVAGMLHPNAEGHAQEAALIGRDLDEVLYGDEHPDGGGGVVVIVHGGDHGMSTLGAILIGVGVVVLIALLIVAVLALRRRSE